MELPSELGVLVVSHLFSVVDVLNLRLVSRYWNECAASLGKWLFRGWLPPRILHLFPLLKRGALFISSLEEMEVVRSLPPTLQCLDVAIPREIGTFDNYLPPLCIQLLALSTRVSQRKFIVRTPGLLFVYNGERIILANRSGSYQMQVNELALPIAIDTLKPREVVLEIEPEFENVLYPMNRIAGRGNDEISKMKFLLSPISSGLWEKEVPHLQLDYHSLQFLHPSLQKRVENKEEEFKEFKPWIQYGEGENERTLIGW